MKKRQHPGHVGLALEALGRPMTHPGAVRLLGLLGGTPVETRETLVGAPAIRSLRLVLRSGQVVVHDDTIVALAVAVGRQGVRGGVDLADWLPGATNAATLDTLKEAFAGRRRFAGIATPYFVLDGGFASPRFEGDWNKPGHLRSLTFTTTQPGSTPNPMDDECAGCSELLVRVDGAPDDVDVAATLATLTSAVEAGVLTPDAHWVALADLGSLHASGLMERVESQLGCRACGRVICFTLFRDAAPQFVYRVTHEARLHPMEPIPPVELWGDEARVAQAEQAMHYVDHQPGAWFLVRKLGHHYLLTRYAVHSMVDDEALVELDADDLAAYHRDGRDAIVRLDQRIQRDPPHREQSRFRERDLLQGPDRAALRDEASGAIFNHIWLAEQRRRR